MSKRITLIYDTVSFLTFLFRTEYIYKEQDNTIENLQYVCLSVLIFELFTKSFDFVVIMKLKKK